ncbi:MAG: UbiA family prenyltransferase, partial [Planctomycetes bacterium]|nr:UbiA family prenyltransferase [Planctomycetota bacterium]
MAALLVKIVSAIQLTRLTMAFGAVADVWFIILLTRANEEYNYLPVWNMPLFVALLAGVVVAVGLYAYGASLNDVLDVRHDTAFSPDRPIPAGHIRPAQAAVVTVGSLIVAVLGAVFLGMWAVCITLLTAAGLLFYNAAGKFIPAVGVLTIGLIHAAHMLIPNHQLTFMLPVWFVMTHTMAIATAVHVLEDKRPRFSRRSVIVLVIGWCAWSIIILGAGMSAIYGEFIPRSGGRPSRIDAYTVSILLAVGISLLLMFSLPLERWKKRFRGLAVVASLGLAPGFFAAMILGPWFGEVSYESFRALFVSPATGEWVFQFRDVFFLPDIGGLIGEYSLVARGLPDAGMMLSALPLALAAYVIGFGDIITGTAIVNDAAPHRPDEKIPIDERRTHLAIGIRNLVQVVATGPFFPLQGPLWAGATVVVAERYRRGRREMDSIFGGIFSYLLFGLPIFYFVRPYLELFRPVLDVAFSLTLILTGFACAYVALSMP